MAKMIRILAVLLVIGLPTVAQQERKFIREGNELFHKQDFEKAEVEYRKALEQETDSYAAGFNLGDAMYKQKKYEEALQQFSSLAKEVTNKEKLGELYHNIGNTLLSMNKLDESIEAYKQSLRNRPDSQETKYNLEFARKQKQEQQQNQNQDQNKDQNQDQNKDQQNQDKNQQQNQQDQKQQEQNQQNQEQKQQEQQQNKQDNQEQPNQQQPQEQQGEGKISKEDAKRLLDALEADEKKTQEKVQKEKMQALKAKRMKIEKNW